MLDSPPKVRILSLAVHERPWALRIPFHYGVTVLRHATEIHVVCDIEVDEKIRATGFAAEIAAPKWFEKSPSFSPEDTVNRLREAVTFVVAHVEAQSVPAATVAEFSTSLKNGLCAESPHINALERSFAIALVERAVIDALCRATGRSFLNVLRSDALGLIDIWPHQGFRLDTWLSDLSPTRSLAVRHTVGLTDALTAADLNENVGGRPVALEDVIAFDGVHQFKIKLGRLPENLARLETIAALLDRRCQKYSVTLDANETFTDPEDFAALCQRMSRTASLTAFWDAVRYIEQPFDRRIALSTSVRDLAAGKPIIIDESDHDDSSFEQALALGYRGVSIKTCKGAVRAVFNAARCSARNRDTNGSTGGIFVTAEDLCVQPGIGLQQNIALAASLGLSNAERNGHHFGPGPSALPASERSALTTQHPDLYTSAGLIIRDGCLSAVSVVEAAGFGTALVPGFAQESI